MRPYNPDWTIKDYLAWNGQLAARGMRVKAERGEYPTAAPFGYKNVRSARGSRLEVDPETAGYVQMAYSLALHGKSIQKIAATLNKKGAKSRLGRKLTPASLHTILTNPAYVGDIRFGGEIFPGNHPKLVSRELAEGVKRALTARRRGKGRSAGG